MPVQFSMLASGSRGNAALVRVGGGGLLIDLGLGARQLRERLAQVGAAPEGLRAALLTHTHGDHVCEAGLNLLVRGQIPLYCHEGHREALGRFAPTAVLEASGLLRTYDERPFLTPGGLRVEPIEAMHDSGPTFGFRIEAADGRRGRPAAVGYLADTGCWTDRMAEALCDAELIGIEFNHDVELQRSSGRSRHLIRRNLGPRGHLSNEQGADLLSRLLEQTRPGCLRHVVLLHLSQECNRPEIALAAARAAVRGSGRRVTVHVADQWAASPDLAVAPARRSLASAHRGVAIQAGFPWEAA